MEHALMPKPHVTPLATAFRACELCSHATVRAGRLLCASPAALLEGGPQTPDAARSSQGICGPNARHMDMPGWA